MGNFGNILDKLKSTIIQTKTNKIDAKLDKAIQDIVSYRSNSGRNGYIDMVRNLIAKNADVHIASSGGGLFAQGGVTPATFGQGARLYRYKSYQAITSHINYAIRALDVLVDNILSPDDITKQVLEIKPQNQLTDETTTDSALRYVKDVIKHLKLERKLDIIVKNTLLSGDLFCEIGSAKTALTSQTLLSESSIYQQKINEEFSNGIREKITQVITDDNKEKTVNLVMNYSSLYESAPKPEKSKTDKKSKKKILTNLHLVFHDPRFIVKLQSSLFPICFGYLAFPIRAAMTGATLADDAINNICVAIIKSLRGKLPQMKEYEDDDELKSILSALVKNTDLNKSMEIRYVAPDKMVHFYRPSTKFQPYGESIFDSCEYTAKVLISLETALAVQRLARSTEKRKIAIEIGLPRDATKAIELMKEEFRKRKISLDSFGTVDTIPSMISTFEDVYIPQKDGKPFVDISTFTEGNVDVRSKVDELKFMRDQLVASLGVPPSFIGIEENLCCRLNTKIKLLSGETIELYEIIRNFKNNIEMWVYSCNDNGKIVPGKITWAGVTKTNTKCVRVTLDNDEFLEVTPDHPFKLRDGTYKEAQLLQENESLMPFYKKRSNTYTSNGYTYESIYHPGSNTWQLTHRAIAESLNVVKQGDAKDVHHIDFCPNNNDPNNLKGLYKYQHVAIHGKHTKYHRLNQVIVILKCIICGKEYKNIPGINKTTCSKKCRNERKRLDGIKSYEKRKLKNGNKLRPDLTCFICGKPSRAATIEISDKRYHELKFNKCLSCDDPECKKRIRIVSLMTNKGKKLYSNIEYRNCEICNNLYLYSEDKIKRKGIILTDTCGTIRCNNTILARRGAEQKRKKAEVRYICEICGDEVKKPRWYVEGIKSKKCDNCRDETMYIRSKVVNERKQIGLNHKVKKIELLEGRFDTGDITIKGYHNFATDAGVFVHNSNKNALSEENILFARTIISHQKYLTHQLQELIQKIFDIIDPEEALTILEQVEVALPSPRSLQFEREARYLNELSTLVENLERIGIPKEYASKKYMPQIDWDEVKKYEIRQKVDETIDPSKKEDDGMGGMEGGFGGGM